MGSALAGLVAPGLGLALSYLALRLRRYWVRPLLRLLTRG